MSSYHRPIDDPRPAPIQAREFDTRVSRFLPRLKAVAERLVGCPDLAADVVQDALLAVWTRTRLPDEAEGWLVRMVIPRGLNQLRSQRRRRFHEARSRSDPQGAPDPAACLLAKERRERIVAALSELNADQRSVVLLRDILGFDYATIAGRLDIPVGTVRSRLSRARSHLRRLIEERER